MKPRFRRPIPRAVRQLQLPLNVQTLHLFANDDGSLEYASRIIRDGGLVAFPTETVYGLGGNAFDAAAVTKIFLAKERPAWDPIIVHVSSLEMLEAVTVRRPTHFDNLCRAFMPGPLTLVLPKSAAVPDAVTAGRETVAVRFPVHAVAQRLIAASGLPIAAPSANRFQHVSPTTAQHATAELDGRIEAILDGGPCQIGVESTVLDLTAEKPLILRQGAVTLEQLQAVLGEVEVANPEAPSRPQRGLRSPGMMSRHYAPRTRLVVTDGREKSLEDLDQEMSKQKVDALLPSGWIISAATRFDWGQWGDWTMLASRLYAGLHWLDEQNLDLLIAPLPPNEGLGSAIRERLLKASGRRCLHEKLRETEQSTQLRVDSDRYWFVGHPETDHTRDFWEICGSGEASASTKRRRVKGTEELHTPPDCLSYRQVSKAGGRIVWSFVSPHALAICVGRDLEPVPA